MRPRSILLPALTALSIISCNQHREPQRSDSPAENLSPRATSLQEPEPLSFHDEYQGLLLRCTGDSLIVTNALDSSVFQEEKSLKIAQHCACMNLELKPLIMISDTGVIGRYSIVEWGDSTYILAIGVCEGMGIYQTIRVQNNSIVQNDRSGESWVASDFGFFILDTRDSTIWSLSRASNAHPDSATPRFTLSGHQIRNGVPTFARSTFIPDTLLHLSRTEYGSLSDERLVEIGRYLRR